MLDGNYELTYVDAFVDRLLREDRICDTALPRLPRREVLEDAGQLEPRVSPLDALLEEEDDANGVNEDGYGEDNAMQVEQEEVEEQVSAMAVDDISASTREVPKTRNEPSTRDELATTNDAALSSERGAAAPSKKKHRLVFKEKKSKSAQAASSTAATTSRDGPSTSSTGGGDAASIEETNRMRAALGLKPLRE